MMKNEWRLPKLVENDPAYEELKKLLNNVSEPLWSESRFMVPAVPFNQKLLDVLQAAKVKDRVARGLETVERTLGVEARGLALVDQKTGTKRQQRISRLIILSNDGAERFYRKVEAILREHGSRVMAVRVDADAFTLGEKIFGVEKEVKLLLLEHKETVAAALLSLTGEVSI